LVDKGLERFLIDSITPQRGTVMNELEKHNQGLVTLSLQCLT